ncbi:MAG: polyhydroxyalkanoate depolymerase [Gammaproteobacteria bacterium]|nr:polyhydroxyalkanoate depolymerase [Gammaproteobacteria bacterium]
MIYQAYEFYSRSAEFMNAFISTGQNIFSHPSNPLLNSYLGSSINATLETVRRSTKIYEKIPFKMGNTCVDGKTVRVNEKVVIHKPFCDLIQFKKAVDVKQPKLLLVAALSGHHATLLSDTVKSLMPDHDVYITDWLDARDVPLSDGDFGFDDYVEYLIEFLEELGPNSHMMAVCQPSVQALVATAVMTSQNNPATPKTLTLMAGPIDTSINPNDINEYANSKSLEWFENNAVMTVPKGYKGRGRKVYPGFIQLFSFMSMNMSSHIGKHLNYINYVMHGQDNEAKKHRDFYNEYMAVLDLTAEFYIETLQRIFKEHHLSNGIMTFRGEIVDLSVIKKTALHTIEGEKDDICSVGQTEAAQKLCTEIPENLRKHEVHEEVGHYGTFSGTRFREIIAPTVTEFINKYN